MKPIIYFAADHAGFMLKNELFGFVEMVLGYEVVDCGAEIYDADDDFTDFVAKAAREVSAQPETSLAIIVGGSGQGEAMIANRFHNVRATVYYGGSEEIIRLSKTHNNANVLSLGARFLNVEDAKKCVQLWLETKHSTVEKYDRRNDEIDQLSREQPHKMATQGVLVHARSIVPSLPAQSFKEIETLLATLKTEVHAVQIDIVDGMFAPYTSWPFTELDVARALLALAVFKDDFEIEMDCMCMHPQQYLDTFVKIGVQRVIIHHGTTERIDECITHARKNGYKIGLGIRNATPGEVLARYAPLIDFVQVMGIQKIGIQGQTFDEKTIQTVSNITKQYPDLEIAVDGAVNADTILSLLQAGAVRFAPGSAITKSPDPLASYKQLAYMIGL